MKKITLLVQGLIVLLVMISAGQCVAGEENQVSHIVLVWLKQPGNTEMRKQFVAASRSLNNLPGIVNRHVGVVLPSNRKIVDDSFDVAVTVTLKDKNALKAYLEHPRHKQVLKEKLKPLVGKIVAYDMISQSE